MTIIGFGINDRKFKYMECSRNKCPENLSVRNHNVQNSKRLLESIRNIQNNASEILNESILNFLQDNTVIHFSWSSGCPILYDKSWDSYRLEYVIMNVIITIVYVFYYILYILLLLSTVSHRCYFLIPL